MAALHVMTVRPSNISDTCDDIYFKLRVIGHVNGVCSEEKRLYFELLYWKFEKKYFQDKDYLYTYQKKKKKNTELCDNCAQKR